MKRQAGFTLIELIMVIVILGILAAVALPRFVNLQADARLSKAQALYGSVRAASAIVHGVSLARPGVSPISMEGTNVAIVFSYPDAATIAAAANISGAAAAPGGTDGVIITTAAGTTTFLVNGGAAGCGFTYTQPAAVNTAPTITLTATLANCT